MSWFPAGSVTLCPWREPLSETICVWIKRDERRLALERLRVWLCPMGLVAQDAPWERGHGRAVRCSVECGHGGDGPAASSQHGQGHRARRDGAAPLQNSGLCAQLGIKPPQIANRISQVQRAAGHDVLTQKQSISGVGVFLVGGHCSDVT